MWNDDDEISIFLKSKNIHRKSRDQKLKNLLIEKGFYWDETLTFLYDYLYCESFNFWHRDLYVNKTERFESDKIFFFHKRHGLENSNLHIVYEIAEIDMKSCPIATINWDCTREKIYVLENHAVFIHSDLEWYLLDSIGTFFDMLMEKPMEIKRIAY